MLGDLGGRKGALLAENVSDRRADGLARLRLVAASDLRFGFGPGPGLVFREGSFSSARISRSAMRRSAIFASSSAIFARMRSSDVSMAALLILNMTTCYFGILARSHSRGMRSIVATRLSIRLTTSRRLPLKT